MDIYFRTLVRMANKQMPTSIAIGPATHEQMRKFCGETRVMRAVVSQVLGWFTTQPETVQRVVLGEVTRGLETAYADALEQLAAEVRTTAKVKKR